MRIRKHAKISPLLYTASVNPGSSLLPSNTCQLNQPLWEVTPLSPSDEPATPPPPPLHHKMDADDSFTGNGSLGDSIGAVESVSSMKISQGEDIYEFKDGGAAPKLVYNEAHCGEKDQLGLKKEGVGVGGGGGVGEGARSLCCRTDGRTWQCKREVKDGHTLCDHHLALLKSHNNLVHPAPRNSDTRRRLRPKKASSSANPHEFYYYSGFGPLWGKKRGHGRPELHKTIANTTIGNDTSSMEADVVEPGPVVVEVQKASSSSQIDNEELDYVEDEDDDQGGDDETVRKRARKPIKARSLKSLM